MDIELLRLSVGDEEGWAQHLQRRLSQASQDEASPAPPPTAAPLRSPHVAPATFGARRRKGKAQRGSSSSDASPSTSLPSSPSASPRRAAEARHTPAAAVPRSPKARSAEWHGESAYGAAVAAPVPRSTTSVRAVAPPRPAPSRGRAALVASQTEVAVVAGGEAAGAARASSSDSDDLGLSDDDDGDVAASASAAVNTTLSHASPSPAPSAAPWLLPRVSSPLLASEPAPLADADSDLSSSDDDAPPARPLPPALTPPASPRPTEPIAVAVATPPAPAPATATGAPDADVGHRAEADVGLLPYTTPALNYDITIGVRASPGAVTHLAQQGEDPATAIDFVFVPLTLERMILFGVLLCLESFLFVLTALPLRCLFALLTFARHLRLHYIQAMDLVKMSILLTCSLLLYESIDTASLRSWIANQHYLKLHVFYTTLQLFDKLFVQYLSSVVAAMAWSLENIYRRRFALHWALAVACILLHACCLIGNVLVLDLAIYCQANSLFTLLILLQFTEIKSGVLKKMKREKLFALCCDDVIDRFYLLLFLVLVFVFNIDAHDWSALSHGKTNEWILSLLRSLAIIYLSSLGVDWLKHMSITTFNEDITPHIYTQFAARFLRSVSAPAEVSFFADKSRSLSQDLGLFPLALSVAVIKIVGDWIATLRGSFVAKAAATAAIWACLLALRLLTHFLLAAYLRRFSPYLDDPRVGILNKLLLIPPRASGGRRRVSITLGSLLSLLLPLYALYVAFALLFLRRPGWPLNALLGT